MCIKALSLILGKKPVYNPLTFLGNTGGKLFALILSRKTQSPVTFHVVEDGKLIILGARHIHSAPNGLYLDCTPE